jgi:hypothetical protein
MSADAGDALSTARWAIPLGGMGRLGARIEPAWKG